MNKTYLSKEQIKELKDFINLVLQIKVRSTLLQIKLKTGLELYYEDKDNKRLFWEYINEEVKNLNNSLSSDFINELHKGNYDKGRDIINRYIDTNYKNEWSVVINLNSNPQYVNGCLQLTIMDFLRSYTRSNNVPVLEISEVIECQNIDELLSRYDRKNVDPELLKKTEMIKKGIDTFYKDIQYNTNEYWIFTNSVNEYLQNRNEHILHNNLNKVQVF